MKYRTNLFYPSLYIGESWADTLRTLNDIRGFSEQAFEIFAMGGGGGKLKGAGNVAYWRIS
jgi:hypothetical protein